MTQPAPSSGMDLSQIRPQDVVKLAGLIGQNPEALKALHQLSDVDFSTDSQHHSLGRGASQAAPGNHLHNGTDSSSLYGAWKSGIVGLSQTNPVPLTSGSYHRYMQVGKTVLAQGSFQAAASTAFTGNLIIQPPLIPRDTSGSVSLGTFALYKISNNSWTIGFCRPWNPSGVTFITFQPPGIAAPNIGNGDGYIMQTGDLLVTNVMYEAA